MNRLQSTQPLRSVTISATIALLISCSYTAPSFARSSVKPIEPPCAESTSSGAPAHTAKKPNWVSAKITIKAPPEEVWRTIHEERFKDPDLSYAKIVEHTSPNEMKLEEKFCFIPVIGSSVCLMNHKEVPNQRIDYTLISSDRFKAMEGSWILTPSSDGRSTNLELTSFLDLGLPVPRSFMNAVTSKKMNKRLTNIKLLAETAHASKLAQARKPVAE